MNMVYQLEKDPCSRFWNFSQTPKLYGLHKWFPKSHGWVDDIKPAEMSYNCKTIKHKQVDYTKHEQWIIKYFVSLPNILTTCNPPQNLIEL